MPRQLFAGSALILCLLGSSGLARADRAAPLTEGVSACASVTARARPYGYGYNHIVTLANRCSRAVTCEVWTNVDPTPHLRLKAHPGETAETTARVGSPSRDVHAESVCRFEG